MPSARKEELPVAMAVEGFESREVEWSDVTVEWDTTTRSLDLAPFLEGLPGDRCQCHHYGYMIKGSLIVQYTDHEETIGAGRVFHIAPGHLPLARAGTEWVEFTWNTDEYQQFVEVTSKNVEAGKLPKFLD